MKETTWTPGPWRIATSGGLANTIEGQSGRKLDEYDEGYRTVAMFQACCASDHFIDREANAKANARLIAAAPEMADALRPFASFLDALELMSNYPKTGETHVFESHVVGRRALTVEDFKAARAALAKACGEQP